MTRRADIVGDMSSNRHHAHYLYATSPSGTVHLIDFDNAARWDNPSPLCGAVSGSTQDQGTPWLTQGDETLSGALATCRRCRRAAGRARIDR